VSDPSFTLIDVILGIHKHGLVCKLSEQSFAFLIGIILEHNSIGFKTPFTLNNFQAMAAGGGKTPQSVRRRRATLCKFKIAGKPLLNVVSGNYGRNTAATYEIDYKSLLAYNSVWSGQNGLPNQICNSSGWDNDTVPDAVALPSYRSEKRREEDHTHTNVNKVTTGDGVEKKSENGGDGFFVTEEKAKEEFERIRDELRYHQVYEPARSEIAKQYQTRYIERQILQIRKDFHKGIEFRNPGGALVARIKKGHATEDYPK